MSPRVEQTGAPQRGQKVAPQARAGGSLGQVRSVACTPRLEQSPKSARGPGGPARSWVRRPGRGARYAPHAPRATSYPPRRRDLLPAPAALPSARACGATFCPRLRRYLLPALRRSCLFHPRRHRRST
jgi:hypothetical protein